MTISLTNHLAPEDAADALRADARAGLTATPKTLPPRWFYDERGSELFDEITRLPEYYPPRAERAVLAAHADAIAAADPAASLNLLLTDGSRVLGTTWADPAAYLVEPDGVVVASEPWDDDPRWTDVPDHSLVEVTPDGLTTTPLT